MCPKRCLNGLIFTWASKFTSGEELIGKTQWRITKAIAYSGIGYFSWDVTKEVVDIIRETMDRERCEEDVGEMAAELSEFLKSYDYEYWLPGFY